MTKRVLVKIRNSKGTFVPTFSQCLLELLNPENDRALVKLSEEDQHLILSRGDIRESENVFTLHHSPHCPIREQESLETERNANPRNDNIVVAVSLILESFDEHVLLTKRPAHMRTHPNVWVPPGGHLESGEDLLEGGARELYEETGLSLKTINLLGKAQILCLWENVFPLLLGFGAPKNHSLVVYFHVRSQYTHSELTARMKIDPEEVGSFTWISRGTLSEIFNPEVQNPKPHKQYAWNDGRIVEEPLNYLEMFRRFMWTGKTFYSGAMCSLVTWYNKGAKETAVPRSHI